MFDVSTPEGRTAARALCDAAEPGEWAAESDVNEVGGEEGFGIWTERIVFGTWYEDNGLYGGGGVNLFDEPTATFIAASRTLLPAALDALDARDTAIREALALHSRFDDFRNDQRVWLIGCAICQTEGGCPTRSILSAVLGEGE